jgi:hypothetical protein
MASISELAEEELALENSYLRDRVASLEADVMTLTNLSGTWERFAKEAIHRLHDLEGENRRLKQHNARLVDENRAQRHQVAA